jgi:LmbE family N-acetylglucosaminyl deacetylase
VRVARVSPQTIVSFHAHPDDEALLTGGTLAMLADAGHRVVLVVATAGSAGLTDSGVGPGELARRRLRELRSSASILGCARVEHLGFGDSGWTDDPTALAPAGSFADVAVDVAAARLADILREERADLLTVYDANGGYGHLDHVRVHDVGLAAARIAGTPRVLEATIDRTVMRRAIRALGILRLIPQGTATQRGSWFSARGQITHRVRVGSLASRKRAALACHRSQTAGGDGLRTAAILLALPAPLFRLVCGTEWFIESYAAVPPRPFGDPLTAARTQRQVSV